MDPFKCSRRFGGTAFLSRPRRTVAGALTHRRTASLARSADLASLGLLPRIDWASGMRNAWDPAAPRRSGCCSDFWPRGLTITRVRREQPGAQGTSRLSPYLHFGEIGPREIWHATRRFAEQRGQHSGWRVSKFLTELGWREFAHHLFYHFPHTPDRPLRGKFANFPWKSGGKGAQAWTRGATGYPIVDAGLRELWHTGWMHNRVRMIAGSFLIKDLLVNWTLGARWFWDTLVDADLASNTLGWQWVAGSGADAAPFFRIFNPTRRARNSIRLASICAAGYPKSRGCRTSGSTSRGRAPATVLAAAGIVLGKHYPHRVVDHDLARREALAAHSVIKMP